GNVRQLVLHIFAVELYFANAITVEDKVDPDQLPKTTLDEIFAIGDRATEMYQRFIVRASAEDWASHVALGRINLTATKRKLVAQALTHSMRHWAQISTYLRQQGFKQEWNHDFLLTKAME